MLSGTIGLTLVSMWAGSKISSPEQAAADALPPNPSTITAVVEERVIADGVAVEGAVQAIRPEELQISEAIGAERVVVTRKVHRPGDLITNGDVVIEVSGRPLFALNGSIPMYRTLEPGDEGPDVEEIQSALASLGASVSRTGRFDTRTQAAVADLYEDAGYEAISSGGESGSGKPQASDDAEGASDAGEETPTEEKSGDRGTLKVSMPIQEFIVLRQLPAELIDVDARAKDSDAPVVTLAGGLQVEALFSRDEADAVTEGDRVDVEIEGRTYRGEIGSIDRGITTDKDTGVQGHRVAVEISRGLDVRMIGSAADVIVEARAGTSEVLAVPTAAVWTRSDGANAVTLMDEEGASTTIEVQLGASGSGFVEVRPSSGQLSAGDRVVVE